MKKVVILDFDGTLADTFKVSVNIAYRLTGHHRLTKPSELRKLKRQSLIGVARELEIPKHMWPFLIARGRKLMTKRLGSIKLFDGMPKVLRTLNEQGYSMYIMSNNSTKNIDKFLVRHGIRDYFKDIYGGVGLLSKSSALRKILSKNQLEPQDVIYVGDEVRDIEASKSVNVPVIAVSWGFNDAKRLAQEQPTKLVYTPKELLDSLESA